jgi:hypothetical protein
MDRRQVLMDIIGFHKWQGISAATEPSSPSQLGLFSRGLTITYVNNNYKILVSVMKLAVVIPVCFPDTVKGKVVPVLN